ncbi:MAG TPA: hypothetical protein VMT30_01500 [Candidatus Saccharimonadia bacterium]|nr:hypothetical protein [Candidatus Saccharimonadia bacterium]
MSRAKYGVDILGDDGVEVAMGLHSDQFSPTLKGLWPSLWAWCEAAA